MRDRQIRAALDQHWAASDANDFETEHRIYHEDAVFTGPYYDTQSLENVLKAECLLALRMNGQPLPDVYGAPLRLRVVVGRLTSRSDVGQEIEVLVILVLSALALARAQMFL